MQRSWPPPEKRPTKLAGNDVGPLSIWTKLNKGCSFALCLSLKRGLKSEELARQEGGIKVRAAE